MWRGTLLQTTTSEYVEEEDWISSSSEWEKFVQQISLTWDLLKIFHCELLYNLVSLSSAFIDDKRMAWCLDQYIRLYIILLLQLHADI